MREKIYFSPEQLINLQYIFAKFHIIYVPLTSLDVVVLLDVTIEKHYKCYNANEVVNKNYSFGISTSRATSFPILKYPC